jgi:hypothetical protein
VSPKRYYRAIGVNRGPVSVIGKVTTILAGGKLSEAARGIVQKDFDVPAWVAASEIMV